MKRLLGNDLVINENDCNLSCQYCLTGQSNLKSSHEEQLIFQTPKRDCYSKKTPLGQRLHRVSDKIQNHFESPFLKVTGGEIFLVKDIMDFIEDAAQQYKVVVVQTNAVLLTDSLLERLATIPNLVMQISLDSHLHSGNSYRVAKESLHDKVVRKIEKVLDSGIPCEIYSVLNDRSVSEIAEFVAWLADRKHPPKYYPFPIRGPDSDQFKVKQGQVYLLDELYALLESYQQVMPPRAYIDRLVRFYQEGERRFRCHLPRLVISTFSDGMVTACPNIWFSNLGSALSEGEAWDEVEAKVGESGLYQALLAERPRLAACKGCFTPWDTLSMYFDDEITLDELCEAPTYAIPEVRDFIASKKAEFLQQTESQYEPETIG